MKRRFFILFFIIVTGESAIAGMVRVTFDYDGPDPVKFNVYHELKYEDRAVERVYAAGTSGPNEREVMYELETEGLSRICVWVRAYRSPDDMGPWSDATCSEIENGHSQAVLELGKCTNIGLEVVQ